MTPKSKRAKPKRVTETLTISLEPAAAVLLRERAARLHRGNVSALVAEMIADARISEQIAELVVSERLAPPSAKRRDRFDREMQEARRLAKRGRAA